MSMFGLQFQKVPAADGTTMTQVLDKAGSVVFQAPAKDVVTAEADSPLVSVQARPETPHFALSTISPVAAATQMPLTGPILNGPAPSVVPTSHVPLIAGAALLAVLVLLWLARR